MPTSPTSRAPRLPRGHRSRRLRWGAPVATLALILSACSSGDGGDDEADDSTTTTTTSTPATSTTTVVKGEAGAVTITSNPDSTLSARVQVRSDVPTTAGLTATSNDGHEVDIPAAAEPSTDQELALVGLRPETEYEVTVEAVDADGGAVDGGGSTTFASGSLPEGFPRIELADVDPERTEPGLTLLSLKPWGPPNEEGQSIPTQDSNKADGYIALVDQEGFVVWYHATDRGVLDARQTDDGYLFTYDETVVREVDALGNLTLELAGQVAAELQPNDINGDPRTTGNPTAVMDTDSAHHDAQPLPSGNLLVLSTELKQLSGPPQCEDDQSEDEVTYPIIADTVVEVVPETGEIVGEWPIGDIFDPFTRTGSELCMVGPAFAPPNFFYPFDERDWTHGNSVVLDEERNALIVSLRHFSSVLAIRYQDDADGPAGELLWELGPDGDLSLDGLAPSYQHAAEVLDDGNILIYDNGNKHPGASLGVEGDQPPFSRAVIYEVDDSSDDPSEWSATQVWEHRVEGEGGRPVFTAFLGDADQLPNRNVLVTHGAIMDAQGSLTGRVIEVAREGDTDGGDIVFDLRVGDPNDGWTVYRSQRIPSAVPGPAATPGA